MLLKESMIICRRVRKRFDFLHKLFAYFYLMLKLKILNYKKLPATCLLAVYLFFSFIAIAGYSVNANNCFQKNEQTALVYSAARSTTNNTVSFKKYSGSTKKIIFDFHNYRLITLLVHNWLAKVKFNSFSKRLIPVPITNRFVKIKTIPQNSAEDDLYSFTS